MQTELSRRISAAISLTGLLGILWLGIVTGDLKKALATDLILGGLLVGGPSLLLAWLGYRRTTSTVLQKVLLASSLLSSSFWLLTAVSFATADAIDAQSGLLAGFVFLLQWGIAMVALVCFFVLRKR